jgi:serine/threonine protein phosphatase 1
MTERLYAIGDIHGCFDPFYKLVKDKLKIRKGDKLVLLGDYIDRGSQSRKVVDFIINLQNNCFDVIPLIGNHESMLIDSLDNECFLSNWIINGGNETLRSFGIESVSELGTEYVQFFRSLPYYYSFGKFLFVHAGFNDEINDPFKDKLQMIWSRRQIYTNPVFKNRTIIHGHTPITFSSCREMILSGSSVLNIDTGCVYNELGGYGHLTAVELFTGELFSI